MVRHRARSGADLAGRLRELASLGILFRKNVRDVVPRVAVQALLKPLLIQVVSDESGAATQYEEAVDGADGDVFLGLFRCEAARIAHQIDEGHADDAVDVEDQIGLLGRGDLFDFEGVLE